MKVSAQHVASVGQNPIPWRSIAGITETSQGRGNTYQNVDCAARRCARRRWYHATAKGCGTELRRSGSIPRDDYSRDGLHLASEPQSGIPVSQKTLEKPRTKVKPKT